MKRIVPARKDLYRMLIFVVIALLAVFWASPRISSAQKSPRESARLQVAQTSVPNEVGGVPGVAPAYPPSVNPVTGATNATESGTSQSYPASNDPNGPQFIVPPQNTPPPPTTPGENP